MIKHKYLKLYKPYFVHNDPIKEHLKRIEEATKQVSTISTPHLFEAVIRTEKYAKLLQIEFIRISNLFKYSNIDSTVPLLRKLDSMFDSYLVKFKFVSIEPEEKEQICGIIDMGTNGENKYITVFCNKNFRSKFLNQDEELFQTFYDLITHELVHRGQFLLRSYKASLDMMNRKIKVDNKITNNNFLSDMDKDRLKVKNYLSMIEEIMAYANQIIEELRFHGLTNKEIIEKIKGLKIDSNLSAGIKMYNDYFSLADKDDLKIIKRLFKYMYQYVVGEEKHSFII
jgi:hypothetical protein